MAAAAAPAAAAGSVAAVLAGACCSLLGALVLVCVIWRLAEGLRSSLGAALEARAEREEPGAAEPLLSGDHRRRPGAPRSVRRYVHHCLEGQNRTGQIIRAVLFVLIFASIGCFVLSTRVNISDSERRLLDVVETVTVLIFTLEFAVRFWVGSGDWHGPEGLEAHCCARLDWLEEDPVAVLDLLSLLPFYLDLLTPVSLPVRHLGLLRVLRAAQLLEDAGAGVGAFAGIFMEKRQVLVASGYFGASVWLICSTLYYHFEQGNPDMVLCPLCKDPGAPDSCVGPEQKASCYGRMDSIPSAMYFCLVNLFGEFPLMLEHTAGGKCVGVFIAIFGNAMAGIAMGVIGNGFSDYVEQTKGKPETEDEEEEAAGAEGGGDFVALPGEPGSGGGAAKRHQMVLAFLDAPRGTWAATCCAVAVVNWVEVLLVDHALASGGESPRESVLGGALDLGLVGTASLALAGPLELGSAVLFASEYAIRVATARRAFGPCAGYVSSGLGITDLLAFAPALLRLAAPAGWAMWLRPLLCLARTVKLERFVGAFRALRGITADSASILMTSGVVAVILLLLFSTLMWCAEAANPVEEVRSFYESVPMAMWITMLNLSGECPLADYTVLGKLLTGFIGVFAVGVFGIPFGLMSGGFQDYLSDDDGAEGRDREAETMHRDLVQQLAAVVQRRYPGPAAVASLLQGSQVIPCTRRAVAFERAGVTMIFASVGLTLLESCYGLGADSDAAVPPWLKAAELVTVLWFTFEFLLRLYAAPAVPDFLSRRRYMLSFCGLVDVICIGPYYLSKFAGGSPLGSDSVLGALAKVADRHDEELRLCRMLRILLLSNYVPSLGLILRVLHDPKIRQDLLVALYVAVTCWLFFATLLHLAEANDSEHPDMAWRFRSVLSSMPFTLIHLTGDYPLIDYTVPARIIHGMMIMTANGLVGVAGGIIASGFTRELQDMRAKARERRKAAGEVLGRAVRRWLAWRRWTKLHHSLKQQERQSREKAEQAERQSTLMWSVKQILHGQTCRVARAVMIILNVAFVLAESVPDVRAVAGRTALDAAAVGFAVLFSADYAAKLYSAPVVSDYGFRRRDYALSIKGIVEFTALLPTWLDLLFGLGGELPTLQAGAMLRVLQLEEFVPAFSLLSGTWVNCKDTVMTSGLIAFMIWVLGSVLFFEAERHNEALEGALDSIPSALHFTAIFLGGEWAVVDFTPAGKLLCVFYCLLGIAVFAIPVGSFFEAFEAAIADEDKE